MNTVADDFQRAVTCLHQGRLDQAEALCTKVLQADRRHYNALHVLGLLALQRGLAGQAVEFIGQSLQIQAGQPVAHLNMSNALLSLGRPREALASCDRALSLRPHYAEALNNRGNALLALERPKEALANYEQALRLNPNLAVSHNNRGNALRALERFDEALSSYDNALRLQPNFGEALIGRVETLLSQGNLLFKLQRVDEALASYRRALELAPDNADAAYNHGSALLGLGRFDEALASFDRTVGLRPDFAKAHYYRGNVLRCLYRPREALVSYARALQINPEYAEAASGTGNVLRDLGQEADALASYERALQLDPDCIEALAHRARIVLHMGRPEEAGELLERLFAAAPDIAPDYNYALGMMLHARLMCCDWRDYDSLTDALRKGVNDGKRVTLPSLFISSSESAQAQLQCARMFVADNWGTPIAPLWNGERYSHDKIRLAYVSADFRQHPVSFLMAGLYESHDPEQFQTIAISLRPEEDTPIGRRVRAAFTTFVDATSQSDREVATLMRELEIDIAVDLTGYTYGCRPGIFAHRPAPVQVNYLGYAGTTAAAYVDYILADSEVIPPTDHGSYTEKVVYLPDCFQPNDSKRDIAQRIPTRAEAGLPENGFVFCCFNAHFKIAPRMFDLWMRLLRQTEGSVLWLSAGRETAVRNLRREAANRGVAPERLVFARTLPAMEDHLARYRLADLFLDTLPFNAHTTASDALWAGVPVLTCCGEAYPGRVAASLLKSIGLPELVTSSLEDYEALALKLGSTPTLTAELRAQLGLRRDTSSLFDTDRFRRDIESAYRQMWERVQRGAAAESFSVTAVDLR